MRAYLEHAGESLELPLGATTFGRDVECALRLVDGLFNRRHAQLILRADALFIEDLGSANGTTVNGTRTVAGAARRLNDGDVVAISSIFEFAIRIPPSEEREPPGIRSVMDVLRWRKSTKWTAGTVPSPSIGPRCPRCRTDLVPEADGCSACPFRRRHVDTGFAIAFEDVGDFDLDRVHRLVARRG